jgi:hypothetical protein
VRTQSLCLALSCLALLVAGVVLGGCGGSSSETPPPLEPLPVNLHYDRSSTALAGELPVVAADAGTVQRADEAPPESTEGPPARSTWGSDHGDKPAPLK